MPATIIPVDDEEEEWMDTSAEQPNIPTSPVPPIVMLEGQQTPNTMEATLRHHLQC